MNCVYEKFKVVEVVYPSLTVYEIHGWDPLLQKWEKLESEGQRLSKEQAVDKAVELTGSYKANTPLSQKDVWP
jgi:hypothetical protein